MNVVCVCACVCMCMHVCLCACACMCVCTYIHVCLHVQCTSACVCVTVCIHVHVREYAYMYLCTCVYVHNSCSAAWALQLLCWKCSNLCTLGMYVTYKTHSYRPVAQQLPTYNHADTLICMYSTKHTLECAYTSFVCVGYTYNAKCDPRLPE